MADGEDEFAEVAGEMGRDEANVDAAARAHVRPTKAWHVVGSRP